MNLIDILQEAIARRASDIFFISHLPVTLKVDGQQIALGAAQLTPDDTTALIQEIYAVHRVKQFSQLLERGDDDFSFSISGVGRFRVNVYRQRNTLAAVIRLVTFGALDAGALGIPPSLIAACIHNKGLVLVTGNAGSGKSTTLACVVDAINRASSKHIITLEDPIEYIHRHNKSIVSQREIASDTASYSTALRAALRQSPDVILLGEMRDHETIATAVTAAETGQLVLSSLHTLGAAKTIDRIIDSFAPPQQHQIRVQLAMALCTVVSQQLLPSVDGGLIPAFEVMIMNPAIRSLIRDEKIHQIDSAIYAGQKDGMMTMDSSVFQLFEAGKITAETACNYASNYEEMRRRTAR